MLVESTSTGLFLSSPLSPIEGTMLVLTLETGRVVEGDLESRREIESREES